nr:hypothetical protein [Tanacetum cinerariifolium]
MEDEDRTVFLMTNYSLWERLARKNELKARGTLLMALPDKHQLKFNIHKDAKTLMEAIEKRFGGNKETKKRTRRNLKADGPTSMGFDMSKVECYNYYMKGHFARECSYDWSFQADEEPTNYALMASPLQVLLVLTMSSKTDESLPASPICDRYHSGDGYHAVPPPYTRTFMPPKPDLVFHDAPNVNETNHTAFNVELSLTKPDKDLSHTHRLSAPIIKDWVSDSEDDSESKIPHNAPSFVQPTEQVKTPRSSVKIVETSILAANYKTTIPKPKSNVNIRNRKACFVYKSLTYLIKDCDYYEKKVVQTPARNHAEKGNHHQYDRMTLLNPQRHVVPTAVLTKSKLVPITAVRPVTAVVPKTHVTRPRPAKTVITKLHSPPRRHINHSLSPKASTFPLILTTAKALMEIQVSYGLGPKEILTIFFLVLGNLQHALKDKGVIDSGCSRHMIGNMSYLSDFKEINGGYFAFGGNPKGGKISGKGKTRTGKLDFDDVYFVKELKFNLFSVSQMCDKKNNVLLTDTECIVLSLEFKLPDDNQVLLRVHMENNMYNVDLKNIVPSGKFDGKADEAFLVGYSVNSVQEQFDAEKAGEENVQQYVLFPLWSFGSKNPQNTDDDAAFGGKKHEFEGRKPESEVHVSPSSSAQTKKHDDKTKREAKGMNPIESSIGYRNLSAEFEDFSDNNINKVNAANSQVPVVGKISTNNTNTFSAAEDITYSNDEEDVGAEADFTNLQTTIIVSPIPTTRVRKDHLVTQNIGDLFSATQTRSMTSVVKDQGVLTQINNEDFHTCRFTCFLSQEEPKRKVWVLVDLPDGKRAIEHTQEEGIDYEEVFALIERIEAIRLFLAYASFMGFMVYQMDVKSAFMYETIEEEVYVCQPLRFEDPDYPDKVYKVVKALCGLHQAPRAWYETLANYLLENDFQRGKIDQTLFIKRQKAFEKLMKDKFWMSLMGEVTFFLGLQVKQKQNGIFISQDKYVAEILREFGLTDGKSASTPIDIEKPLLKDPDAEDMDVHTYISMIGSLMYLTSSRPDIMFAVYACAHFQYPKDSPFNLVAYSDSDYTGASLDRMSITVGFKFLGCILISWQCKKQTVVSTSSTEAEYVAATYCCVQVLWIQNQLLDNGVGKGFSGVETPLFEGMIVAQQANDVADEGAADVYIDADNIAQTLEITKLKQRVKKLERRNKLKVSKLRRLKKVGTAQRVDTSKDTVVNDVSKQGEIIANMDADEDVTLKDVAAVAKEVAVAKDAEIEENADVQGRQVESQAQIYQIDLEHADKVLRI